MFAAAAATQKKTEKKNITSVTAISHSLGLPLLSLVNSGKGGNGEVRGGLRLRQKLSHDS